MIYNTTNTTQIRLTQLQVKALSTKQDTFCVKKQQIYYSKTICLELFLFHHHLNDPNILYFILFFCELNSFVCVYRPICTQAFSVVAVLDKFDMSSSVLHRGSNLRSDLFTAESHIHKILYGTQDPTSTRNLFQRIVVNIVNGHSLINGPDIPDFLV